ncbi:hypothetical protein BDB00DRAFT_216080 [Zychaea mexicana]|uniref:uncharacterized protein n=1 Tax=Zychaea mexicana TaxID=64656 RepID=UPI0022FF457A|nr:uncharacterized protein BDB00DRAFT_216080 [Zychaea mexicana]KAI9472928.1 hypothetical protein BDB00DRAFT_216080 [Zychaea mexicana]
MSTPIINDNSDNNNNSSSSSGNTTNAPPSKEAPDFSSDPRMKLDKQTNKWSYVGDDGIEYEYDTAVGGWFPMHTDALIEQQQSAYAVAGVDESEPAVLPRSKKKRVYTYDDDPKKQKRELKNTSVYVTGVPTDATMDEMKQVFSKCGVIMEDLESGLPKIKIYQDQEGKPKGDALVTYFKEESVPLAINLLDESELRLGDPATLIKVQQAQFKEKEPSADKKKNQSTGKNKNKKRLHQLNRKLDWVEEEGGKKAEKFNKIVILKNMYTHEELDEDPTLLLELKEDVREECEKLGEVTNVILYDKSPGGVISVRFMEQKSAEACVLLMNNRYFAGRQISAEIYDGKERYEKSGARGAAGDEEEDEAEKARLERYAKWLEQGGSDDEEPSSASSNNKEKSAAA